MIAELFKSHDSLPYVIGADLRGRGSVRVCLKPGATVSDELQAAWAALRVGDALASGADLLAAVAQTRGRAHKEWKETSKALAANGFELKWALLATGSVRVRQLETEEDEQALFFEEAVPLAAGGHQSRAVNAAGTLVSSPQISARKTSSPPPPPGILSGLADSFYAAVLPGGFPDSVAPEYVGYQVWDTLQVLCSDLRGAVTTQASLLAIGVGASGARAEDVVSTDMVVALVGSAVTLAVGSTCSASRSAPYMKLWRILDTVLSFVSACLTMVSGMVPSRRLMLLSLGTVLKSIAGPLGGGARTMLVLHLANYSVKPAFLADVAQKEKNQDRILGLTLMVCRFGLLLWIGLDFQRAWLLVIALSFGHLTFNFLAVQVLEPKKGHDKTMNKKRKENKAD